MSRNLTFKSAAPHVQQPGGHAHVVHQAAQIGIPESPYLTLDEGALFCRFDGDKDPADAFRRWLRRHAVPIRRCGRKLLVEKRVLEVVMSGRR